jgi:hypothetical protein
MTFVRTQSWPSAGLIAGPGAWIVSTQLNYALAPHACGSRALLVALAALALVLPALAGATISWRAWRPHEPMHEAVTSGNGDARLFVAGIGVLAGVLFALVVAMQGMAALILDGCIR